jgi:hypothetical protein
MLMAAGGCRQEQLLSARLAEPFNQPSNVYDSDGVPGHKLGVVPVGATAVDGIGTMLADFMHLDPGVDAHGLIVLNPTAEYLAGIAGCTPGANRACLILRSIQEGQPHVSAFGGDQYPWISTELISGMSQKLSPYQLSGRGRDLPTLPRDMGEIGTWNPWELLSMLAPYADPQLAGFYAPYGTRPVASNLLILFKLLPDVSLTTYEGNATGLWWDAQLVFPAGFVRANACYCDAPAQSSLPPALCNVLCTQMKAGIKGSLPFGDWTCDGAKLKSNFSMITLRVGFVPFTRGAAPWDELLAPCEPERAIDRYESFDTDRVVGWMRNLPFGIPYRQPCLGVRVMASVPPSAVLPASSFADVDGGDGVKVRAAAFQCDSAIDDYCATGLSDCDGIATAAMREQLVAALRRSLPDVLRGELARYMEYQPPPGTPLMGAAPPAPCPSSMESCQAAANDHYVPASVTFTVYNWFAAPFAPSDPTRPWNQYPFTGVKTACPQFTRRVPESIHDMYGFDWGHCVRCPPGVPWLNNGVDSDDIYCDDQGSTYMAYDRVDDVMQLEYLADPDADGLLAPDDNCPFAYNKDQKDYDGDGVGDPCDNCPYSVNEPNPGQENIDGDDLGDVCDPCNNLHPDLDGDGTPDDCEAPSQCPCDPVDPALTHDMDGWCDRCVASLGGPGSFCESYCAGPVVVDNCPGVWNTQGNCNKIWEVALGAQLLGDHCDPVPCARARTEHQTVLKSSGGFVPGPNNEPCWETDTQVGLSAVNLWPTGSYTVPELVPWPGVGKVLGTFKSAAVEYNVTVGETRYRYCVNSNKLGATIKCSDTTYYRDAEFLAADTDRKNETWQSIWHKIVITGPASLIPMDSTHFDAVDTSLVYGHDATYERTWAWQADFFYWRSSASWGHFIDLAYPTATGQDGKGGVGVLWVYANSKTGMDSDDLGTGIHPRPGGWDPNGNHIANFAIATAAVQTDSKKTCPQYWDMPPLEVPVTFVRNCWNCDSPVVPGDFHQYVETDTGPLANPAAGESVHAGQLVVRAPSGIGKLAVLRPDGTLTPIDAQIGEHLSSSLASNLKWTSQVEAYSSLGGGAHAPAAVALSPDGTGLAEVAFLSGGKLLAPADFNPTHGTGMLAAQAASDFGGPPAREGFIPVYARADNRIFVVGGAEPQTHNPLGDIWYRRASGDERWFRIDLKGYAPSKVLAATSSYVDHRLWVLDETPQGSGSVVRLHRVEPLTGAAQLLGTWPKSVSYDAHWLSLDMDGTILLTTSSTKLNRYFVIRIDNQASTPSVGKVTAGKRTLASAPMVDEDGYLLLEIHGQSHLSMERMKALTGKPGHWDDVGACL